jgi:ubiquinone/menaquinone biosynthesis C-methylase UbiE
LYNMKANFLKKRKNNKSEESFHDEWAKSVKLQDIDPIAQFEAPTSPEYRYAASLLQPIQGKKILVLGCGLGEEVVYLAKKGASVYAVDISLEMINFTKKLAEKYHVQKKVKLFHTSAEEIPFPKNSFDAVFACNLMHHIQLKMGVKKVYQVLKKGGVVIFLEPLAYNPVINVYRKMASEVRTDGEHPITFEDLEFMKEYFPRLTHKEFHFFTLLIFVWFYIGKGIHPNKERYWKKIIHEAQTYKTIFQFLHALDRIVLRLFPSLSKFYWVLVIKATKEE